jgi:glycine cleavage system H lipoate-binding protein
MAGLRIVVRRTERLLPKLKDEDDMQTTAQQRSPNQTINVNLNECCWMQGGVVDYKLCDRNNDCEHCPFDRGLHGRVTMPSPSSFDFSAAGTMERNRAKRLRESKKEAKSVQGCEVAGGVFYHPGHTWARIEDGGCVRTGLDDFARRILGRPYLITMPEPGTILGFGEACWYFTHQGGVSALAAPVSGKVKEINPALAQQPALLSRDPYGEGWALLIEPTDLKSCLRRLLYGPKVTEWYEREFAKLYQKITELSNRPRFAGPTRNNRASLNEDFRNDLTADQLRLVIDFFFPLSLKVEKAETNQAILVKHGGGSW